MEALFPIFAFALGAIIGSFLNVVIHRYPSGESIVFPPSRCPNCRNPIAGYDNIPILSYLILRGRCRSCRSPISSRYPIVELSNALFYLAAYLHTGLSAGFFLLSATVSMLIILIYVDMDIGILPDVVDLPGIAVGLTMGTLRLGETYPSLVLTQSFLDSLIGAAAGAIVLLVLAQAYKLVRKVEGMGLGDVKMLAMIGAVLGWRPLLPALFAASLAGAVLGLIIGAKSPKGLQVALPFGIFLGLATLLVIFQGQLLLDWYMRLLTGE